MMMMMMVVDVIISDPSQCWLSETLKANTQTRPADQADHKDDDGDEAKVFLATVTPGRAHLLGSPAVVRFNRRFDSL